MPIQHAHVHTEQRETQKYIKSDLALARCLSVFLFACQSACYQLHVNTTIRCSWKQRVLTDQQVLFPGVSGDILMKIQ